MSTKEMYQDEMIYKVDLLEAKVEFLVYWLVEAANSVDFLTNASCSKQESKDAIETKLNEFEKQFSEKYNA
tara:strand:+ start:487 stop:699 length:213 start_codon:yes stop_codon:yes gene_type:complete